MQDIQETTDATFEQDVIARSLEVPVVVDFGRLPAESLDVVSTGVSNGRAQLGCPHGHFDVGCLVRLR